MRHQVVAKRGLRRAVGLLGLLVLLVFSGLVPANAQPASTAAPPPFVYDDDYHGYDQQIAVDRRTETFSSGRIYSYDDRFNHTQPHLLAFASFLAAEAGGARFVVSSDGETRVLLKNGLEVGE